MHTRLISLLVLLSLAVLARPAAAQPTVFLVRHAERADASAGPPKMATDPDLSPAGHVRAESLATTLKDAGITAVFATEFKRNQQTAAPIAKALGLTVTTIKAADEAQLVKELAALKSNALVIGHSNTVPRIMKALGAPPAPDIPDGEFDNLYVLTRTQPSVVVLHLRYK
jgi:broad specificity phosphatase PhoE